MQAKCLGQFNHVEIIRMIRFCRSTLAFRCDGPLSTEDLVPLKKNVSLRLHLLPLILLLVLIP